MKQPPLKGKSTLKKVKSASDKPSKSCLAKDPTDQASVIREQIMLFFKIVRNDLPKKIAEVDQLRRKEFTYERLKQKCLTGKAELKQHFVELNSRNEVDDYQKLYTLSDLSANSFLFPNGLVQANHCLDELVKVLANHREDLQRFTFECTFALELAVPAYEKRSAFEYSLLQNIQHEFASVSQWANSQHSELDTVALDFHAQEMLKIAYYPQHEDRRKAFIRHEKKQLKELAEVANYLFFQCTSLLDVVCKNGDKLGLLLCKARSGLN